MSRHFGHDALMSDHPVVLRWRVMLGMTICLFAIAAGGVVLGIVGPAPQSSLGDHLVTILISAALAALALRGARTKLVLGPTEVTIYNWLRTHHVPWSDIKAITVDPRQGIRIHRCDGRVLNVENPAPTFGNIISGRGERFLSYESAIRAVEQHVRT
jgi:hypothetical protein